MSRHVTGTAPKTVRWADLQVDDRVVLLRTGLPPLPVRVLTIERYVVAGRSKVTFVTADGARMGRSRFDHEPLSHSCRWDADAMLEAA